jgi:hypothetical protein
MYLNNIRVFGTKLMFVLFLYSWKAEELGREPTVDEVFLRTHIRKKDSDWVDLRSKNTYVRKIKALIIYLLFFGFKI